MPVLYIIGGCNGAGKTTASLTILPEVLNCKEFVNADNIAAGISPFNVEGVAIEAGRIMLNRVNELLMTKQDFAFETTLSTLSYVSLIKKAKVAGYNVSLIYFWLSSPEMAKERVAFRVLNGGHYIPDDIVERRYKKGIRNLFKLFMPLVDSFMICDNSSDNTLIIARKENSAIIIENSELWDKLNRQYYEFSA